jgi:hypothetical protein
MDPFNQKERFYYDDPDILALVRTGRQLYERRPVLRDRYGAEVAVFVDPRSAFWIRPGVDLLQPLVYLQLVLGFAHLGAPFDVHLIEDIGNPALPEYKLYVFLDTVYLTGADRAAIQRRVRTKGKTALWVYAPGYLGESGASAEAVSALTGIRVAARLPTDVRFSKAARIYLTDLDHPITRGGSPAVLYGTDAPVAPILIGDDPEARVLGRLLPVHGSSRGVGEHPGLLVKEIDGWTSVFSSAPNLPPFLLRNIARTAGVHVYSEADDVVTASERLLMVHAGRGGPRRLHLPRRTDAHDAFTGRRLARHATSFVVDLPLGGTSLFVLGDARALHVRRASSVREQRHRASPSAP